jgi:flagellar basal-body rod modification protein FlgD
MLIEELGTTYNKLDYETSSNTNSQELGQEDFLTLLIEQLKNQDPLNPMESVEFTAQLAEFTSLEQLFTMNDSLSSIEETLYSQGQDDILQLIGKTVKASDNTILIEDDTVSSGSYILETGADVTITIYDSNGSEIWSLNKGWQDAGEYDVEWDGKDSIGEMVEEGTYTFEVTAKDADGNDVTANTYITGEVTGVTYKYGDPYLMIGDRLVSTDHTIIEVKKTVAQDTETVEEDTEAASTP